MPKEAKKKIDERTHIYKILLLKKMSGTAPSLMIIDFDSGGESARS